MKILKWFLLGLLLLVILIPVGILTYLGLMPGLSTLLGTNKPRDLGIVYSEKDQASGHAKSKITYAKLPATTLPAQSIQRTGSHTVKTTFSSAEMTALMNNRPWKYWPYKDVQIKFNGDGSVEISGILAKDKLQDYGMVIGAPQIVLDYAQKYLPNDPVFYVKGRAALTNNEVSLFEPQAFEIGRLPLPLSTLLAFSKPSKEVYAADLNQLTSDLNKVKNKKQLIIDFINERLSKINGFYANSAYFAEDQLYFDGKMADQEATVQ